MIAFLNVLALSNLLAISYQDLRERQIYVVLLLSLALLLAGIHYAMSGDGYVFALNVALNLILVLTMVFLLYLITKWVFKKTFLDHSFGTGDLLLFLALALAHPTYTFVIILVGALLFALLITLVLGRAEKEIPLAGYICLFYILVSGLALLPGFPSLYTL